MDDMKNVADMVLNGEKTIIDFLCEISALQRDTYDDNFRLTDADYWKMVRNAQNEGKKLILINGPVPVEIIYAMDCVPLYLDFVPPRLSENTVLTGRLMGEADKRINTSFCSMNKTELGALLCGNLGLVPDAYVNVPIACDSACAAYSVIGKFVTWPVFNFDIPLRKDGRSLEYVTMQCEEYIEFMERITDNKLDWDKLKYRMELSNNSGELLDKCSQLRHNKPCPMSSHLSVWNELMNAISPTAEMEYLLKKEIEICNTRIEAGISPCLEGEKHRVLLLHNLFWQGVDISSWLEREYNAITVMDGFCFGSREFFEHLDDKQDCVKVMSRRMLTGSRVHGAVASGVELCEMVDGVIKDYGVDVSVFLGNAGCRHAWATQKLLTDSIHEKHKLPTLVVDVDNTDRRYKSNKDIKIAISEYMDTVVNKK